MGEYSIKNEESRKRKEIFEQMVKDAGFDNIRKFCKELGVDQSNIYSNLDGSFNISIKRMFKVANLLGVPIVQVIGLFYPDELAENQSLL